MKKLGFAALAVGVLTASCSGHGGGMGIPSVNSQSRGNSTTVPKAIIAAPLGWSATNTQAITNILNASDLGALNPNKTITVRVALQLQNMAQLQQLVASGQTVDQSTFMSTYAPTSAQVNAVTGYLQSQGLSSIQAEPNNLIVSATGTASQVAKAFDTQLESYSVAGVASFANTQPAFVPSSLGGTVVAVLGLNNLQAAKTHPKINPNSSTLDTGSANQTVTPCDESINTTTSTAVCPRFYDPYTFQTTYDALGTPAASKTSIAIMTEGNLTTSISDFRSNEAHFGLVQAPITIVPVGLASSDTSGSDEWTLDMTYSTGMARQVQNLYLYNFTSLSDSDIVMGFNKWVTDHKAPIANSSFGGCELFPYLDGSMLVADMILVQGAAQGHTMFVSTGYSGSFWSVGVPNGVPAGAPFAEWPSVSPYVTAVGGTDLFSNPDGSYLGENSWESGGGGVSQFEYSPYWESGIQPATTAGSFRGVPDVAMDASLETGALLWMGGTEYITGGTSLASPLAAGVYARAQSAHNNSLGFGPVAFYNIYRNYPNPSSTSVGPPPTEMMGGFHDILSGANGAYTALPKYDYTTGLGSFDVGRTNAVIN